MAGDWIKMREDLHEDPAVLWMAQQLDCRPETVVGYCHRFWGLVSRQTCDGRLIGPTLSSLGNVIALPGFPELLVAAGWLEHDVSDTNKPVTNVPKFERHLSEGAKARALARERKRLEREAKTSQKLSRAQRDKCHTKSPTRARAREEQERHGPCHASAPVDRKQKQQRTDVPAADIADLTDRIFRECGYSGGDGGNLWGVAALVHLGTGDITESELWSACRGASLNGRNKAAHFFACLSEALGKRGLDLAELLRTVRVTPTWPKERPRRLKSAAVKLKSSGAEQSPESVMAELERLERSETNGTQ